jgi:UDP-2,4-diacetamido-2,4,6-trideoxy-beta-L-altropyranose hydrolase
MKAVFRCDASVSIGAGHVVRCLSLAGALAEFGIICHFVCHEETLATVPELGASGHEVVAVPSGEPIDAGMLSRIFPSGCHVLIIDHYELDASWEKTCKGWAGKIFVIDDLADRPHDCDFLLDSAASDVDNPYIDLAPEQCQFLLGPENALLRPEFAKVRAQEQSTETAIGVRVFIMFGGVDTRGIAPLAVEAVLETKVEGGIHCDVVSGPRARSLPELRERAENSGGRIILHVGTSQVAALMARADIAIGAAGGTSWERCCLGLPAISVSTVDNQESIAEILVSSGAVRHLGTADDVSKDVIQTALQELLGTPAELHRMAKAAAVLCDGRGAKRVVSRVVQNLS